MQNMIRKIGDNIKPSRFTPRILKIFSEKIIYTFTASRTKKHILLDGKLGGQPVFCIVHWNATDFLLLNVSQIEFLYPNSKIYILDNGSKQTEINDLKEGLKRFKNITLFAVAPKYPNWLSRIGADRILYTHTNGLQFLLNYAAENRDEIAVFLDQDCILYDKIDTLTAKLDEEILLVGARLDSFNLVHASFMIMQPKRISQLFGRFSFLLKNTDPIELSYHEPYHGLSFRARGKIFFLETKRHHTIPVLSSYSTANKIFAWHAWLSSRTVGYSNGDYQDGIPISYRRRVRERALQYMTAIAHGYSPELGTRKINRENSVS